MGAVNWTLGEYGDDKARTLASSKEAGAGTFTAGGAANPITGAEPKKNQVFSAHCENACRIAFGGRTASASVGHFVPAGVEIQLEIAEGDDKLPVSVIEV